MEKYGVARVPIEVIEQLTTHIDIQPVHTCAIACRYSLYDVANQAARATFKDEALYVTDLKPDYLSLMGINQYQHLVRYRLQASKVAADAVETFPTFDDVDSINNSMQVYIPGSRASRKSCDCSERMSVWSYEELNHEELPIYIVPWLDVLKRALGSALQIWSDVDTVTADGKLVMEAVKVAVDSKCSACIRDVSEAPWVLKKISQRVEAQLKKVSSSLQNIRILERTLHTYDRILSQIPLPFQAAPEP